MSQNVCPCCGQIIPDSPPEAPRLRKNTSYAKPIYDTETGRSIGNMIRESINQPHKKSQQVRKTKSLDRKLSAKGRLHHEILTHTRKRSATNSLSTIKSLDRRLSETRKQNEIQNNLPLSIYGGRKHKRRKTKRT